MYCLISDNDTVHKGDKWARYSVQLKISPARKEVGVIMHRHGNVHKTVHA